MSTFNTKTDDIINDNWSLLTNMLCSDLEQSAKQTKALSRKREVDSASDLLRLAMAYGFCGRSLRDVACWSTAIGLAKLSDVALLKRLKNCADWLGYLVAKELAQRASFKPIPENRFRLYIVDATTISSPGSKGADFRVHLGFDPDLFRIDQIELSTIKKGESLTRFHFNPGDLVLCDRAYSHRKGIASVIQAGGQVLVRLNWHLLPLQDATGNESDLLDHLRDLGVGESKEIPVQTLPDPKQGIPAIPGRVVALRKSEEDAQKSKKRLRRKANRNSRIPNQRDLELCQYVILFTSVPADLISAQDILELYRFRWQIELVFKRLKSILFLDEIAAKNEQLCRTFFLSKLLGALLMDELSRRCDSFSPCRRKQESTGESMASL